MNCAACNYIFSDCGDYYTCCCCEDYFCSYCDATQYVPLEECHGNCIVNLGCYYVDSDIEEENEENEEEESEFICECHENVKKL